MQSPDEREGHLRALAGQLFFKVEKSGDRFSLTRTVDVPHPVSERGLSLTQAEEFLETWKLRGFHGG